MIYCTMIIVLCRRDESREAEGRANSREGGGGGERDGAGSRRGFPTSSRCTRGLTSEGGGREY